MELSRIQVVARVQTANDFNNFSGPRIRPSNNDKEPAMVLENADGISLNRESNEYSFSRCLTDFNFDNEFEQTIDRTLDGYDAATVFMSTSSTDAFRKRQDTIHRLLTRLDERLNSFNQRKQRRDLNKINMKFAYLGITDDGCYDLRSQGELKNSEVLEHGLDARMKSVKCAEAVWEKIKFGSKFPSILALRLSDGCAFQGTLLIVDLLHPWSQTVQTDSTSIHYSFTKLTDAVDRVTETRFEGAIPIETSVLTKLLGNFFCGLHKTTVFMEFDEYPGKTLNAALNALGFAQKLRLIRSTAARNEPDTRIKHYQELSQKLQQESTHALNEKRVLKQTIQTLREEHSEQMQKAIQLEHKLQQTSQQLKDRDHEFQQQSERLEELQKKTDENEKLNKYRESDFENAKYLASSLDYENVCLLEDIRQHKVVLARAKRRIFGLQNELENMTSRMEDLERDNEEAHQKLLTERKKVEAEKQEQIAMKDTISAGFVQERKMYEERIQKCEEMYNSLQEAKERELQEERKAREELDKYMREHDKEVQEQFDRSIEIMQKAKGDKQELQNYIDTLQREINQLKEERKAREELDKYRREHDKEVQEQFDRSIEIIQKAKSDNEELQKYIETLQRKIIQLKKTPSANQNKLLEKYRQEAYDYAQKLEKSERAVQEWKFKALKAEREQKSRTVAEIDEDSEPEPSVQRRVLPSRTTRKTKKSYYDVPLSNTDQEEEDDNELPKVVAEPPVKGRPERSKKQPQPADDASIANTEKPKGTATRKPKKNSQEPILQKESADRETEASKHKANEDGEDNDNTGADQSPVLEYQIDLEMPAIVVDEDTQKQEDEVEEEEQDTKRAKEALNVEKQVEPSAPPRKKRKLKFAKALDYDEELLSPLSKVNNNVHIGLSGPK